MPMSELRGWAKFLAVEMPPGKAIELAIARAHHSYLRAHVGKGGSVPRVTELMTPMDPWKDENEKADDVFRSFVAHM